MNGIVKSHNTAKFAITETSYKPNLILPNHHHEKARIVVAIKGSFTEIFRGKARYCDPLTIIYRSPNDMHSDHFHAIGFLQG